MKPQQSIVRFLLSIVWVTFTATAATLPPVVTVSAQFLGTPYQLEPIGEGRQGEFNQRPLFRFDRFDCQTYVDTVLALSLAQTRRQPWLPLFLQLRYQHGVPKFQARMHFPAADWLPNAINKNLVTNVTATLGVPLAHIKLVINRPAWYRHLPLTRIQLQGAYLIERLQRLQQLQALASTVHCQTVDLAYLPVGELPSVANYIPNGAVILIVNPSTTAGTKLAVTHMGFAVWQHKILWLRAASSLYGKVIDVPLLPYLRQQKVKGILVLQPVYSNRAYKT